MCACESVRGTNPCSNLYSEVQIEKQLGRWRQEESWSKLSSPPSLPRTLSLIQGRERKRQSSLCTHIHLMLNKCDTCTAANQQFIVYYSGQGRFYVFSLTKKKKKSIIARILLANKQILEQNLTVKEKTNIKNSILINNSVLKNLVEQNLFFLLELVSFLLLSQINKGGVIDLAAVFTTFHPPPSRVFFPY